MSSTDSAGGRNGPLEQVSSRLLDKPQDHYTYIALPYFCRYCDPFWSQGKPDQLPGYSADACACTVEKWT